MTDRASLLDQLRIERPQPDARGSSRSYVLAFGAVLGAAAVGAVLWWLLVPRSIEVASATVVAAAADTAAGPGSILDASGYVVARRQATVSSKLTGKVLEVLIEEGQRVERDEVIARLDDANARAALAQALAQRDQARASLAAAETAFENAIPTFRRNEQQLARAVISAQTFDTAKAAYDAARAALAVAKSTVDVADAAVALATQNLEDTVVRAPFAGVVTVKAAQEGEMVSPISAGGGFTRTGIGTIVDMSSLEVEVDVSESFIQRVRPQQHATARLNAYPDWDIPARVIAIIPTADRAKATVKVRVGLAVEDPRILPQMGVRVAFLDDEPPAAADSASAFLVPVSAVQVTGDTGVVFVIADGGIERRSVRLGGRTPAGQVVLSGVAHGTRVAVGDLTRLADGMRVRVTD